MKTENFKSSKKEKKSKPFQDMYSIQKSAGVPNEMILSLGYVGLNENVLDKMPVERRQHLFLICQFLHVVISESMKEKDFRDNYKMLGFLRMAMDQTDKFYEKTKDDLFLFHALHPHNQVFKMQPTNVLSNK